jgi:hypothetical protein
VGATLPILAERRHPPERLAVSTALSMLLELGVNLAPSEVKRKKQFESIVWVRRTYFVLWFFPLFIIVHTPKPSREQTRLIT